MQAISSLLIDDNICKEEYTIPLILYRSYFSLAYMNRILLSLISFIFQINNKNIFHISYIISLNDFNLVKIIKNFPMESLNNSSNNHNNCILMSLR